jgi:imidazoleglycerol phosphate dehydratase HisB
MSRKGEANRETNEVSIGVVVDLDGNGEFTGKTQTVFMDHMLKILCKHGHIDLSVRAEGDLKHHIIEDLALTMGRAIGSALGNKAGINRFGYAYVPMDDALARAVVDLGGRAYSRIQLGVKGDSIEDTKVEDIYHFLDSLAQSLQCNLHIRVIYGDNDHHRAEAAFKALALAMRMAVTDTGRGGVPSTKGEI